MMHPIRLSLLEVVMGRLIAFFGIPVCSAIVTYAVLYILSLWFGGEPPTVGSIAVAGIFGGLSLVVVLISLNSWVQARKSGERQGLWFLIPVLLVIGIVVGAGFAIVSARDRLEMLERIDMEHCTRLLGESVSSENIEACMPVAQDCRRETFHASVEIGSLPQELPRGVEVSRAEEALLFICMDERL